MAVPGVTSGIKRIYLEEEDDQSNYSDSKRVVQRLSESDYIDSGGIDYMIQCLPTISRSLEALGKIKDVYQSLQLIPQSEFLSQELSKFSEHTSRVLSACSTIEGKAAHLEYSDEVLKVALEAAVRIPVANSRSFALADLSQTYKDNGFSIRAIQVLQLAESASDEIVEPSSKLGNLVKISEIYQTQSHPVEAHRVIRKALVFAPFLLDGAEQSHGLKIISKKCEDMLDLPGAEDAASLLPDIDDQAVRFVELSDAYKTRGDIRKVIELLDRASQRLTMIPDGWDIKEKLAAAINERKTSLEAQ